MAEGSRLNLKTHESEGKKTELWTFLFFDGHNVALLDHPAP